MNQRRNSDVIVETVEVAGKRVIDVGCGDGGLARHLARHGAASVLGVETSPRQLAKARAADPVAGVTIVEGVAEHLPAEAGSADLVVFFNSLHHVPGRAQALAEAVRVLAPGGLVYVSEPVAEGPFFEMVRPVDDETEVRAQAYDALRNAPGLTQEREFFYVHTVRLRDFAALRERIVSANSEREAIFAARDAELCALFGRLATPCDDGHCFDQPMRVNVLRRP
jgi:SAM-dependent methyltransferase